LWWWWEEEGVMVMGVFGRVDWDSGACDNSDEE
jgi:hypothetical protein